MLRFYKPVADRLRPTDRMVAHTGYLVFARAMQFEASEADKVMEIDDASILQS
jgi:tRNA (adenine57-N1/adenine58-N1)-methyltransferase